MTERWNIHIELKRGSRSMRFVSHDDLADQVELWVHDLLTGVRDEDVESIKVERVKREE